MVSRQAWRNRRNQYYVNGQACAFTDVAALLKSHGFDLDHKRFLILQVKYRDDHIIGRSRIDCTDENQGG